MIEWIIYEFAHLSLQEYLAATQIKESQQESILLANFDKSWWQETIRLYAAQSDVIPIFITRDTHHNKL